MSPLFHVDPRSVADGEARQKVTPSGHTHDCDWHCDQYPQDCTCELIPQRKATA
jgi:hypothetical protein